ncbi:hypothetical protein [Pseudomonas viridiflava]|uniref:hypothetical protein n=1 Tax=Pseudomonas viridiflava TaxID=33069 RepID=UPI0004156F55|nr:hypothetical protein [Pseudomonas viridiflava]
MLLIRGRQQGVDRCANKRLLGQRPAVVVNETALYTTLGFSDEYVSLVEHL